MKHYLLPSFLLALYTTPILAGLFGPDEETIELRKRVAEQQTDNSVLIIVIGILIAVAIINLIVGAILGSRTKKKGEKKDE